MARKRGRFERAHTGTIFLDEIGELPLQAQTRLLRVLQYHEIERVGGETAVPLDIRIITATHRHLEKMVLDGAFREDLWFRLNVFPVIIPPLRDRKGDIPSLAQYFIETKSKDLRIKTPPALAHGAIDRLMQRDWPGNIRELENAVERELIKNRGQAADAELRFDEFAAGVRIPSAVAGSAESGDIEPLDEVIRKHIQQALSASGGKIHGPNGAAERLGVYPTTLRSRMDKLGISFRRSKGRSQG